MEETGGKSMLVTNKVERVMGLSQTLEMREDLRENFRAAFHFMEKNVKQHSRLDAEQYGKYSAVSIGMHAEQWRDRYTQPRNIGIINRILDAFYTRVQDTGHLTLTSLAKLYDDLGLREPLLDGNGRAQMLALSHILLASNYDTPDMTRITKSTWKDLGSKFRDPTERSIEFLKSILPEDNRPPLT